MHPSLMPHGWFGDIITGKSRNWNSHAPSAQADAPAAGRQTRDAVDRHPAVGSGQGARGVCLASHGRSQPPRPAGSGRRGRPPPDAPPRGEPSTRRGGGVRAGRVTPAPGVPQTARPCHHRGHRWAMPREQGWGLCPGPAATRGPAPSARSARTSAPATVHAGNEAASRRGRGQRDAAHAACGLRPSRAEDGTGGRCCC